MYSWLRDVPFDDAEVVTPTNRLARGLRTAYDRQQAADGRRAWTTPSILPWTAWLRRLLGRAAPAAALPLLLEPPAAAIVWERLLRAAAGERLLNASGLVRQVQQTWQRVQDWQVSVDALAAAAGSEDQRLFAAVAGAYERELAARGFMDTAQMAAWSSRVVAAREVPIPAVLVPAGFERMPPAMRALVGALEEAGCRIRPAPVANRRRSLKVLAAADGDAEMRAAGAWARSQLEANPSARLAVVCASLEANAGRSARLLREGLAPGWQFGDRARLGAVDVSYGRRLSDYPMIAASLSWLKWVQRGLATREAGALLRSPFAAPSSIPDCERLELKLRRLPDREWSAADLAVLAGSREWTQRLREVTAFAAVAEQQASPGAWAGRIDAFLSRLGWPGDKVPDSAEFQLLNRWRQLLDELALLEPVRPSLRFSEAFARLASLAAETLFQPESETGIVQLLGPLEAAGLEFDGVWVANLEAMQWPAPAWPMPLVSRGLQRQSEMPDATPADTLEHARRILGRIAGSAGTVVLSWPLAERDAELVASPLLDAFRSRAPGHARDPGWFAARLCGGDVRRETDDPAPALRPGERVTGGAYTVQCQFEEPFAAFACGRLGARVLPPVEVGLSASLRGRLIHQALSELLKGLPSLKELRQWSRGERERRIDEAVDLALRLPLEHADDVLRRLLALERTRLRRLLHAFLDSELERPTFSVASVERRATLERHGVVLDLRVDRVDRLADGSLLVIDYKTGAVKNLLTAAGEPAEWQPVVYAAALEKPIGGLLLVNVDSRRIVYRGTGAGLPWSALGPEEWALQLATWTRQVDQALAAIAAGDVRVRTAAARRQRGPLDLLSRAGVLDRDG